MKEQVTVSKPGLIETHLEAGGKTQSEVAGKAQPEIVGAIHAEVPAETPSVERFKLVERVQHLVLLTTFLGAAFTGMPLKYKTSWWAAPLMSTYGGVWIAGRIHRFFAATMLLLSVFHLGYLAYYMLVKRISPFKMPLFPTWNDVKQVGQNLAYFLGLRKERPAFTKFAYYEKFDYWAVFWGIVIIGGSGLVLWFPTLATRVLPGIAVNVALIMHSDEALLAVLAIFIWHFYNVHWNPDIFPMNWTMFTGRISLARLKEEHRGEYQQLVEDGVIRPLGGAAGHGHHDR
ncbi:MAG: cytochrome b/b6 domain-containing protein [Firmicutes bacterium]|nr:cytochrome b/b6 domain-containing protein [Bacillota bacterium]